MRSAVAALLFCLLVTRARSAETPPEIPREFRGVWVATVYNLNWPLKAGLPTSVQQEQLRAILDRAVELRLNAILFQVRPSSDAFYASKIEPWSSFLNGKMDRAPEPAYDPLEYAVREAHARGLELHAWFNPFRALASASTVASANHVTRTHPEWIRRYGSQLWIDPGEPAAREYVRNVIMDVVRRYDVDGVHIDDYFYPYPVSNRSGVVPFPDDAAWNRYQAAKGAMSRDDWRRDNINQFVDTLYRSVKAEKRWVKFGVSPFGIWRPRVPETIEAQLDSYAHLYADSRRWLAEGWCDYFSPQLYWSISPAKQSFPVLLDWWNGQNRLHRHIWPGVADDRIGANRTADEISRQIELVRRAGEGAGEKANGAGVGAVHWDVKSLLQNKGGIFNVLRDQVYSARALVPASPWLGSENPAAPTLNRDGSRITWKTAGTIPCRWWAVQTLRGSDWNLRVLPAGSSELTLEAGVSSVAVRGIDRFGNASGAALAP
jgi:uncharacterized lipoprotein YddW (UPF0748 family)